MKLNFLYIFLGGGTGSVVRYYLSFWIDSKMESKFPVGTFVSNMLASLIFGLIAGYMVKNHLSEQAILFLLAGFCGGFSTFSTFSKDNYMLFESGDWVQLILNICLSIILGVVFFFIGLALMKNG